MSRWHFLKRPRRSVPTILQRRTLAAPPCLDSRARFQETREQAKAASTQMLAVVSEGIAQGSTTPLETYWDSLHFLSDVVHVTLEATRLAQASTVRPSQEEEPTVPEYLISSWFLARSQAFLMSNPHGHEMLHFVTGIKINAKSRTLADLVKVPLSQQSEAHAQADPLALQKILTQMDAFGHHVHGLFHRHPGIGAGATQPSGTDLATQERYENGGYPLIGGICTRDGWYRFFAHHPFTITLHGTGVTQHEEHLFQIQNAARHLSEQTLKTQDEGRSSSNR